VWLCSTPQLIFVPDRNGDDAPDGPAEVVLDGFNDSKVGHNVVSGMTWGPDGWLYGRHGIQGESRVGPPGATDAERTRLNCCIWRLHPVTHKFEVVCAGTTNPWGLDFDDHGQAFFTNNVIGHLWRVLPGARYQRMYGQHYEQHLYELMTQCADHLHFAGTDWTASRTAAGGHGERGGGHSHCGGMIYLGDNWPPAYRGSILMGNIHGNRLNRDVFERKGAGYTAVHAPDFLMANDPWFRATCLVYGPDGGVYVSDWNDFGECHDHDGSFRASGRIYKVTYGQPKPLAPFDLSKQSDEQLVALSTHRNDWWVRHARRILQERAAAGSLGKETPSLLWGQFVDQQEPTRKLRALWALRAIGAVGQEEVFRLLGHEDEHVRWWAVAWACELDTHVELVVDQLAPLAEHDPSDLVALGLASALNRLPIEARRTLAPALLGRKALSADKDYPLLLWYGVEPLVAAHPPLAITLIDACRVTRLREFIARRLTHAGQLDLLSAALARERISNNAVGEVLAGMVRALEGRRGVGVPDGWTVAYGRLAKSNDPGVRRSAERLALMFGDRAALEVLRARLADDKSPAEERRGALAALVEARAEGLAPRLHALLGEPSLREAALKGLGAYDDPKTPTFVLKHYAQYDDGQKQAAIATLAARAEYAEALLTGIEAGDVPARDVPAFAARQIEALGDAELTAKLKATWGDLRNISRERRQAISEWKKRMSSDVLAAADLSTGKALFAKTCGQCHKLNGQGGAIGPDLTGGNRDNLDYVLENILDPSAVVGRDWRAKNVLLVDGRLVSGIVKEESEQTITLQTATDRVVLAREDIDELRDSRASMMPEGTLNNLSPTEVRDLLRYVMEK
jgi:putative membrane-bound dehydrogenase-like protein